MNVRLTVTAVALALLCAGTASAHPAAPTAPAEKRPHGFNSVSISPDGTSVMSLEANDPGPGARTAPTGSIIIRNRATGAKATIGCPPDAPCQLSSPLWSPDGKHIAYFSRDTKTRDLGIWVVNADGTGGKNMLATPFKGAINGLRWAPGGTMLSVLATADAHKEIGATQAGAALVGEISASIAQDVQRIATIDSTGRFAFASPADLFIYEYDWMPSESGFAATGAHGNGDNNWWIAKLYTVDRAAAVAHELYAPKLQINAPRVSPDGKSIAFISGIMSDFGSVGGDVWVIPTSGGVATDITPGMKATANAISWTGHNDAVTFTGLMNDSAMIDSVDVGTKTVKTLWAAPMSIAADGMRVSIAADGVTSALVQQDFETPPEIYAGPIGGWKKLTNDNEGVLPVVHAQSVKWTNDKYTVQGWLVMPRKVDPSKKYPMIVNVHGGPSAASGPGFVTRGNTRDFIDRGYFVFLPNPRGSYGQGEAFTAANVKDFGYGDLRDILTGIDAAEKVAPVDDKRLGITGFSYGGYMTMWAVTQTNRFKAAAAGAGIANWQSYYGENGIDQWMIPFFGATVYDDPAVYAKSSPITFIKNVKTPTFVYVGERDVECPAPQSFEFWHALETEGVTTSLVVYEGEGHGIRQPAHTADITKRVMGWFDKYLK
jgi:dipeptidyl aminopeptidase/acylaminoacyl peptidase